ncbi:type I-E CRISPR-associated protein Cas5/CasD [Streptomyces sp. NPDC087420]|uniref:type I-E CRISPR-associated protein Cas5/CasD n=1 Tax=Streptomyces sp. NPDC087420 TaxID=3365785 RepID=UPI003836E0B5
MSRGLVLRAAGPLQSYGEAGTFAHRDTAAFPTCSALIGMFAAAQGRTREHALDPYPELPGTPSHRDLVLTIRIDRPGTPYRDWHTTGGGRPHKQGLPTSDGTYRTRDKSTHISRRDYLVGAVFAIAVQGPAPLLAHIATTLAFPHFSPFLGRRICLPDEPLLIHTDIPDPHHALRDRVPLTLARPPHPGQEHIPVVFWSEQPPYPGTPPDRESPSEPVDFASTRRSHLPRPLWKTTEPLPATLYAGPRPVETLTDYILKDAPCRQP